MEHLLSYIGPNLVKHFHHSSPQAENVHIDINVIDQIIEIKVDPTVLENLANVNATKPAQNSRYIY